MKIIKHDSGLHTTLFGAIRPNEEAIILTIFFALQTKDKHVANANETLVYLRCPETDCVTDKRLILVGFVDVYCYVVEGKFTIT